MLDCRDCVRSRSLKLTRTFKNMNTTRQKSCSI